MKAFNFPLLIFIFWTYQLLITMGSEIIERGKLIIQITKVDYDDDCDLKCFGYVLTITSYFGGNFSNKEKTEERLGGIPTFPVKTNKGKVMQHTWIIPFNRDPNAKEIICFSVALHKYTFFKTYDIAKIDKIVPKEPGDASYWKYWTKGGHKGSFKGRYRLECYPPFGGAYCSECQEETSLGFLCPLYKNNGKKIIRGRLLIRILEYHNDIGLDNSKNDKNVDDNKFCDHVSGNPCEVYFLIKSYLKLWFKKGSEGNTSVTPMRLLYDYKPIYIDKNKPGFLHIREIPIRRTQGHFMDFIIEVYDSDQRTFSRTKKYGDDILEKHEYSIYDLKPTIKWKYVLLKQDKRYISTETFSNGAEKNYKSMLRVAYKLECSSYFDGAFCTELRK